MLDLHGKNYGFTLLPTYQPIAEDNCVAVASKTRKNILITMQVCSRRCLSEAYSTCVMSAKCSGSSVSGV